MHRPIESFIALFDCHQDTGEHQFMTQLKRAPSGRLEKAHFPQTLDFSYGDTSLLFQVNHPYEIFFPGSHPTDELGNQIVSISGIIVIGRDDNGDLQPFIADPNIIFEHPLEDFTPPVAILLTPYTKGMEIYDLKNGEVIFSIPVSK